MSEVYFMFQGQVYLLAYRKLLGVLLTGKTQQQNDCSKIFGLEPLEILIKWTVINFSVHLFLLFFFLPAQHLSFFLMIAPWFHLKKELTLIFPILNPSSFGWIEFQGWVYG